jgi:ribosomal-protein-alanine N-acetyltransferase
MSAVLKPLEMQFRPMREADLDDLLRIERAAYPYPWTLGNFHDCLHAGYSCWVGELEGKLAGYWLMMNVVDEGHILNCCIAPQWQGQGYGRRLMDHLFGVARDHGARSLFLEVRLSNVRAKRLYAGLGFEFIGQRRAYYPTDDGREDALVMRLEL